MDIKKRLRKTKAVWIGALIGLITGIAIFNISIIFDYFLLAGVLILILIGTFIGWLIMKKKAITFIIISILLILFIIFNTIISSVNYIKYGLPNCRYDGDCKIDETCAVYGNEFEISVNKCVKLNCNPHDFTGEERFLIICNEGKPPSWKFDGIGEEYIGETHSCLAEGYIDSVCRKVKEEK